MNDHDFNALLAAVERGEPLPDDLAPDESADLAAARLLFAARRPMPPSLTEPAWSADDASVQSDQIALAPASPSPAPRRKSQRSGLFGLRWVPELALLALIAALGALALLGSRSLAPAQGEATPAVVGTLPAAGKAVEVFAQWGGASYAVVADGAVAYLGVGPRVVTLDIGASGEPKARTVTDILPGVVHGLALGMDGRLVAAAGTRLHVFESAPNGELTQRGRIDLVGPVQDVAVGGDTAYAAVINSDASLVTVDISDPAQPRQLSSLKLCDDIHQLAVHEQFVVAACGKYGVFVADVSDLLSPKVIGSWDREGEVTDVALRWPYAYIADFGARVLDLTDPTQPVEVDTLDDVSAEHVAVSGDRLVLSGDSGLFTYDLAMDPIVPQRVAGIGSRNYDAPWSAVSIDGDWAFVAHGWSGGLDVFGLRDTAELKSVGTFDTLGMSWWVAASAGRAYAVDFVTGNVRMFTAGDGSQPDSVGQVLPEIRANGIAALGTTLFAAAPQYANMLGAPLRIWETFDPTKPRLLGQDSRQRASDGYWVAIADDRAVVLLDEGSPMGWITLEVIDVGNPMAPRRLGRLDTSFRQNPAAIAFSNDGRTVYIAENAGRGDSYKHNGPGALEIIDVSDPSHPHSIGFLATPRAALGVDVQDSYAYVAATDSGLRVIDVSRPDAPHEVAALSLPGGARDVVLDGHLAYVAYFHGFEDENTSIPDYIDDFNGVVTVDITDPTAPRILHDLRLPGGPRQLALDRATSVGPVLWVAAQDAGLVGVRLEPPAPSGATARPQP